MKTTQILIAGFGGQGILFAGKFLAYKGLLGSHAPVGRTGGNHLDEAEALAFHLVLECLLDGLLGVLHILDIVDRYPGDILGAFQNQIDGKGFSLIEVVSACPTNWGMTPQKALEWVESDMLPYYPLGVYKDRTAAKEAEAK